MSSDNDSVQDVLDSLDDLFEGAMAPHDEEPPPPANKAKRPAAAPADEADAILDELLGGGGTATGAPLPEADEKPHVHPGARDGAVLDDSLNTLIYDSAEEGLNVGHLNTSPTPPPPEEELPSTEALMEDDLLSDLLGGDAGFDSDPPPAAKRTASPTQAAPTDSDADAILNELLGGGELPGNEKPLDEFLAEQKGQGKGETPPAAAPSDDADAILDELLGGGDDLSAVDGDLSSDEADAILDGLLGNGDAMESSGADAPVGDLAREPTEEAGAPASPLDTTDEILGDLLGETFPAPTPEPAAADNAGLDFGDDEDALLNELLGGNDGPAGAPSGDLSGDDADAMLDELLGGAEMAPPSADDDVEGLESLEDVFELGDGTITEKRAAPADEPSPPTAPTEEETIPLLEDVVIPGDQIGRMSAPPAATPTALSPARYDELLSDLAGELQVRLVWRIEQQLKGAMEQLVHDALEQASVDLKESIQSQLKESLPSVLDRLSGK